MFKIINKFLDGAKEGWHEEGEAIASISDLAISPIVGAIAGYNYLKEHEGKEINPVFAVLSMAGIVCSPLAAVTAPTGLIADAALLTTCPLYMFYKGCKELTKSDDNFSITSSSRPL